MRCAKLSPDGLVIRFGRKDAIEDRANLHPDKPYWVPVVERRENVATGPDTREDVIETPHPDRVEIVTRVRDATPAEIDADKEGKLDAIDRLQFRITFDLENRVRALEGKAPVTAQQYRNALKAKL